MITPSKISYTKIKSTPMIKPPKIGPRVQTTGSGKTRTTGGK